MGGAEIYVRQISERCVRAGCRVSVATTNAGEVEAFWNPKKHRLPSGNTTIGDVDVWRAPIRYLPGSPITLFLLRRLTVALSHSLRWKFYGAQLSRFMPWVPDFEKMIDAIPAKFDLVHGINIALERIFIAAYQFAKKKNLPFVATPFLHLGEARSTHVIRNYTMPQQLMPLHKADAVIVQTELERRALEGLGVEPEKLHVLGMGVEPEALIGGDKQRFLERFGLKASTSIILFIGVMTKDKGTHHLIAASNLLFSRGFPHILVLIGAAAEEFEIIWRTIPLNSRKHILRLGPLSEFDQVKRDALAAADVLVLPSRVDSFGIVLLEAWLYGKPVIGARAGGIPNVIANGRDGLLVDYGDVFGLANALEFLLKNPTLRAEMGQAGRAKVLARHTWDTIFEQLVGIYSEVVQRHKYC